MLGLLQADLEACRLQLVMVLQLVTAFVGVDLDLLELTLVVLLQDSKFLVVFMFHLPQLSLCFSLQLLDGGILAVLFFLEIGHIIF